MDEGAIELEPVDYADKVVLRRLIELYLYDYSEYMGWDVDAHGVFGYRYLDHYWTESDRHPFFIRVDRRLAGFALVRSGTPHVMAEFFVMRRYRRTGVGRQAAQILFQRVPGAWEVSQLVTNVTGTTFWRSVIPVGSTRGDVACGGPLPETGSRATMECRLTREGQRP